MKLYIGITILISLALSTCVLFISLMQLVKGAQFLSNVSLVLFVAAPLAVVLLTVTYPLRSIYPSL